MKNMIINIWLIALAITTLNVIDNIQPEIKTDPTSIYCESLVNNGFEEEAYELDCNVEVINKNIMEIKSWREPLY